MLQLPPKGALTTAFISVPQSCWSESIATDAAEPDYFGALKAYFQMRMSPGMGDHSHEDSTLSPNSSPCFGYTALDDAPQFPSPTELRAE